MKHFIVPSAKSDETVYSLGLCMSATVLDYIRSKDKILAIRTLRDETGCRLLDCKKAVENIWSQYAKLE